MALFVVVLPVTSFAVTYRHDGSPPPTLIILSTSINFFNMTLTFPWFLLRYPLVSWQQTTAYAL